MKHIASAFIVVLATVGPSLGAPATPPTAEQVLAQAKTAQGGDAWNGVRALRTRGKISTGGLDGSFEALEDVMTGAYVDRFDLGPLSGAEGFDGHSHWTQDPSGMARVEGSEEATTAAVSEAYRRARAFWFPDRQPGEIAFAGERVDAGARFQVLTITPREGRPFELWINAGTGLLERVVQKEGPDLRTTILSDYREISGEVAGGPAGLKLPFTTRSTNGNEKYDILLRIESVEFNTDVPATAFALPPPPAVDSGFNGKARAATVPFEVFNGHVFLRVTLNGVGPFRLLFDTGGMNVIVPRVAEALGVKPTGALEGRGTGEGSQDVAIAKLSQVDIGPAWMKDQTFYVIALHDLEPVEGVAIDGLIGYEVFRRFIVRFDYERGLITLTDPASWKYAGTAAAVPFVFNDHVPQVEGSIDGIAGKFDIDTGSRSSLDLFGPFVEKHQLATHYQASVERITGWGLGGPARGLVARGAELRLGPVTVKAPVVELSRATRGSFASDFVAGNVGYGILRRFNITFDYPSQHMYFEPNRNAGGFDAYDRSGMWVNLANDPERQAFVVVEVVPGGPADRAGIKAGARITRLNGRAVRHMGLSAFRARLRQGQPGTRLELSVSTPNGDRPVTLVLRDMV